MFREVRTVFAFFREQDIQEIVRSTLNYLGRHYLFLPILPYVIHKIRSFNETNDLDTLINFTYSFWHGFIQPWQIRYELVEFVKYIKEEKPRVILEIGTALGGTLFLFCHVASENAVLISLDLPLARWGGGYSLARIPLYESFITKHQQLFLIREDSHKLEILEKVKTILNGKKINLLFIDGDHTYEGVKKDFEMYSPLVEKNGVIAIHDIIESKHKGCEVYKFWNEIELKYEHKTIVENYNQHWGGIGLIKNKYLSD